MKLEARTILVTRARGQNRDLRTALELHGARVVEIPTIEIAEPLSWLPVDEAVREIDEYDWVVLTSVNAADAFRARTRGIALPQVAVVGRQTARHAEALGMPVALVPRDYRSEGLLDAFPSDMEGTRLLLPRADIAGEDLPTALRARGARVDTVIVYRTRVPAEGGDELRALLESGVVDCVTFTSGSTFVNLIEMLGSSVRSTSGLDQTAIAVIGPVTRRTVEAGGFNVAIEAGEASISSLVDSICRYFEP